MRELSVFLAHLSINDPEKEKIEEGRKVLGLVQMNVFLKKGILGEKLSMSSLFINTIYANYAVLILKKREEEEGLMEEGGREEEEGLFLLMNTLNTSYTDLIQTTNNIFYRLETEVLSTRHPSSSSFFPSLSILVKGSQMLVYEKILLVLFRKMIGLVGVRREGGEVVKETFGSLINVLFNVSWNLIDLTLLKKTLDTCFIEKMLALILKIIHEALSSPLKMVFLQVLSQKSFKSLKFLIKILFVILFEKIEFEDFEIKRQEGEEVFREEGGGGRRKEEGGKEEERRRKEEDEGRRKGEWRRKEEGRRNEEEGEEGWRRREGRRKEEEGVEIVVEEGGRRGKEKCVEKMLEV